MTFEICDHGDVYVYHEQLYDFTAPQDCPTVIAYHPSEQAFACGFESGVLRVFNVATTTMLIEHKYAALNYHVFEYSIVALIDDWQDGCFTAIIQVNLN